MRITTDEQIDNLVARIVAVLPAQTEEEVQNFLDARFTAYNKDKRIDAHLKTKSGNQYLPYPANIKFVGRLYDNVKSETEEDPYDI